MHLPVLTVQFSGYVIDHDLFCVRVLDRRVIVCDEEALAGEKTRLELIYWSNESSRTRLSLLSDMGCEYFGTY